MIVGRAGSAGHRAVLAAGERSSGASIHLVDHSYDTGPVIAQVTVPVEHADCVETLAARVQEAERALLVRVLGELASGERALPRDPAP